MMLSNVIKNKCEGCQKFILLHNKIMECQKCKRILHSECASSCFEYNHLNKCWICWECFSNSPYRYNPFSTLSYDKHDPNNLNDVEDLLEISNILENCSILNTDEFNRLTKTVNTDNNTLSVIFNNIDGNASNFDMFATELSQYKKHFSVIGIAETNIEQCHKDLYMLQNYNSEYGDKFPGKKKGSGLGLYIHNTMIFNRIEHLCKCTQNIETLFVKLTNIETPTIVGVVYRPPNGNVSQFMIEFDMLLGSIQDKNAIIMGDYVI